jgi:error-prone DNA polymerase
MNWLETKGLKESVMYLNCKTVYSFCYGVFTTAQLVAAAVEQGVTTLALTNVNSTYDEWEFVKLCREAGIKPVLGVEIQNGKEFRYILLAKNNNGLAWIHAFLSDHLMNEKAFPLCAAAPLDVYVIYAMGKDESELLPNERIGVRPSETTKLLGMKNPAHYVVRQPVTLPDNIKAVKAKTDEKGNVIEPGKSAVDFYYLHCLLRAVDTNVVLSKLDKADCCEREETFVSPTRLLDKFRHYPALVTNTYQLLSDCSIEMDFGQDKTKQVYGGSKEEDMVLLEKIAMAGLPKKYGRVNKTAYKTITARLKGELDVIRDMAFGTYFHIVYDFIRYADARGFYHVGRGSGANSLTAYCMTITEVDPIKLNLYFERFLNSERTSPPDFDIDFSHTDRDEIIDYIFTRYGKKHVALLGSCPTFKHDSIIRQLGKVYGLPDEEIKALQRSSNPPADNIQARILQYGSLMRGFPYNPSLHPCGILISEEPILNYASLFMPPKGFQTVLMDMFTAEDIGLNKFDVLSQRGLGHIKEALALIKANHGIDVDIHDVDSFQSDPKIKHQIREALTIGCFYIESPAMRGLLKKLRCDDYITLVAASSIIRPGVAQSGMMRTYIERFHDPTNVEYIHPLFKEHLSETFGVMVFQEDVIKIAHYYGGLSLGQADILRRAMSGKYRSSNRFNQIKNDFFSSAIALGREPKEVVEVWRQMESFAGYSFNKAHSASFAVESYMSLYLKTYYPQEFMVAVINNFGGFYSRELYFLELLKCGGIINAPCVNRSDYYTNIHGHEVYVGFVHIKGLQQKLIDTFLEERKTYGDFLHVQDFIERTGVGLEQLNTLIRIGALRFTGKSKKTLLWEANFLQKRVTVDAPGVQSMFSEPALQFELPILNDDPIDDLYDQMELMNFTITNPFAMVETSNEPFVLSKDMGKHKGKTITMLAYFIARKHVTTVNEDQMFFGTFVDSELNWIDTVHFPDSAKRHPLHSSGFYKVRGKVAEDFGVYSLEVSYMEKMGYKNRSYVNA